MCPPFIPACLDDAALSPAEFRVFCRVSRRGECTESVPRMAASTGVGMNSVRDALQALTARGFITCTPRPGETSIYRARSPEHWQAHEAHSEVDGSADTTEDPSRIREPSQNHKGSPLTDSLGVGGTPHGFVRPPLTDSLGDPSRNRETKVYPTKVLLLRYKQHGGEVRLHDSPLPLACPFAVLYEPSLDKRTLHEPLKSDLPDDHPARLPFPPGTWQHQFASAALTRLEAHSDDDGTVFRLSAALRRTVRRDRASTVQTWADVFDKLERLDGYSRDEIQYAMRWLFENGRWLERGYIGSISQLRTTVQSGERTKFESIFLQARNDEHFNPKGYEQTATQSNGTRNGHDKNDPSGTYARIHALASAA